MDSASPSAFTAIPILGINRDKTQVLVKVLTSDSRRDKFTITRLSKTVFESWALNYYISEGAALHILMKLKPLNGPKNKNTDCERSIPEIVSCDEMFDEYSTKKV